MRRPPKQCNSCMQQELWSPTVLPMQIKMRPKLRQCITVQLRKVRFKGHCIVEVVRYKSSYHYLWKLSPDVVTRYGSLLIIC